MCTREIAGQTVDFGTTGYTHNSVFVLYDRDSDSIWHPMSEDTLDAVAGDHQGAAVTFEAEPAPTPLAEWLAEHPESTVLLPGEDDLEAMGCEAPPLSPPSP